MEAGLLLGSPNLADPKKDITVIGGGKNVAEVKAKPLYTYS